MKLIQSEAGSPVPILRTPLDRTNRYEKQRLIALHAKLG